MWIYEKKLQYPIKIERPNPLSYTVYDAVSETALKTFGQLNISFVLVTDGSIASLLSAENTTRSSLE